MCCCLPSDIFSIRSAFRLFSLAAGRKTACHYSLNLLLQDKKMENYNLAFPEGRCLSANDDISSIIKQIRELLSELRDRGIDDGDIIGLLSGKAKNARVRLGPDRMLVLADENPIKIKLTPVESTLYKLVLKYPDGINADELWKYREELSDIYGNMTVYDDMGNILNIIDNICDEDKSAWYTNISRIKRKITGKLGKLSAEKYIIKRCNDGLYRIQARAL